VGPMGSGEGNGVRAFIDGEEAEHFPLPVSGLEATDLAIFGSGFDARCQGGAIMQVRFGRGSVRLAGRIGWDWRKWAASGWLCRECCASRVDTIQRSFDLSTEEGWFLQENTHLFGLCHHPWLSRRT
jgi:hypothetical protein